MSDEVEVEEKNALMNIEKVQTKSILRDNDFNCRLGLQPIDVKELAESIRVQGLIQPVVITPLIGDARMVNGREYSYKLIAGYRRMLACQVNKMLEISAVVIEDLSPEDQIILNLTENIQRSELNIKEEAHALKWFKENGPVDEFALGKKMGTSRGWVQVRLYLLDLPEDVQDDVVEFKLPQKSVRQLRTIWKSKMDSGEGEEAALIAVYANLKAIKESKLSGRKQVLNVSPKEQNVKRIRTKAELMALNDYLIDTYDASIYNRCLAWAVGEVSDRELKEALRDHADDECVIYIEPML